MTLKKKIDEKIKAVMSFVESADKTVIKSKINESKKHIPLFFQKMEGKIRSNVDPKKIKFFVMKAEKFIQKVKKS